MDFKPGYYFFNSKFNSEDNYRYLLEFFYKKKSLCYKGVKIGSPGILNCEDVPQNAYWLKQLKKIPDKQLGKFKRLYGL